jgi:hypothetical protein
MSLGDAQSRVNPEEPPSWVQPDWISLYMLSDPEDFGSIWYGTGQPKLKGGDIVTWWHPDYSEE